MAVTLTGTVSHTTVVTGQDDPDKQVNKNQWNGTGAHQVSVAFAGMTAGQILYPSSATAFTDSAGFKFDGSTFTLAAGTITTDLQQQTITVTRNAAGVTFGGALKVVITDTASAAGSLAMQILGGAAGTSNLFSLSKGGAGTFAGTLTVSAGNIIGSGYLQMSSGATSVYLDPATHLAMGSGMPIKWYNGTNPGSSSADTWLSRSAASVMSLTSDGSATGATLEMFEQTAPSAPAANGARLFCQDNGAGKTQLMIIFNTGAAIQLAIQV